MLFDGDDGWSEKALNAWRTCCKNKAVKRNSSRLSFMYRGSIYLLEAPVMPLVKLVHQIVSVSQADGSDSLHLFQM